MMVGECRAEDEFLTDKLKGLEAVLRKKKYMCYSYSIEEFECFEEL